MLHFPIQCDGNYRVHQGISIMHSGVMDTVFSIVVMHGTLCHKIEC